MIKDIEKIENVVLELLEKVPAFRSDDYLLYCAVVKRSGIDTSAPFREILIHHKELNLPNFKSVERARRKIQEYRQDLVNTEALVKRADAREQFKEYSKN